MNTDAHTTLADIAFDTGNGPATLSAPQRMGTVLWTPMQAMALPGSLRGSSQAPEPAGKQLGS